MMKCTRHTAHGSVADFFQDRLGIFQSSDFRGCLYVPNQYLGLVSKMDHVAIAVGFNGFIGRTCTMHVVIQKPEFMTRGIIRESFEYPFKKANIEVVLGLVDSVNEAAAEFDRRVGFTEINRIPKGGLDGDLIIFQMTKADCRWIRSNHE